MPLVEGILERLRDALGVRPASLHEPWFARNEWKYVNDCVGTGWVSAVGSYVDEFERDLAKRTGRLHAVAVANGTVGLQVALEIYGVGPTDDVIVPALSSVATANAVKQCGTEPHFADGEVAQTLIDVVGRRLIVSARPETRGSPSRRAPDMALAQSLTQFQSTIRLREGVARTYDWYRTNVFDGPGVTAR